MRKKILSCVLALLTLGYPQPVTATNFCEQLASPRGVAITTMVYGSLSALSNAFWWFRYNAHLGVSDELSAQLQEYGGVFVSLETVLLGVVVPAMVWGYVTKQQAEQQEQKQSFIQFIWGRRPAQCPALHTPPVIVIE